MTFVIPMAGKGSRFVKKGFKIPKYMIKTKGKTLFEYSLESLPLEIADKVIFICLKKHEEYNVSSFIKEKVNHLNIEIIMINEETRGQAETVYKCRSHFQKNDDLVIYNIDTAFHSNNLKNILLNNDLKKDGVIGTFIDKSNDDKWSFASIDNNYNIIKTTEKEKISNFALTGFYHFSRAHDFFETADNWIKNNKTVKNEFYIAPMYNDLIKNGNKYVLDIVDKFIPLGTPEEIKDFESNM